ncbi:MAG: mechanosensitive ion channel family protein [Rhodospirillaceae bacterium]
MRRMDRLLPVAATLLLAVTADRLFGSVFSWSAPERFDYGAMPAYVLPTAQLLGLAYLCDTILRELARWLDLPGMGPAVPKLAMQIASCVIYFSFLALILQLVFDQSISALLAASGIAGLVVGFALRGVVSDIFSGIALNLDRSFKIADIIEFTVRGQTISGKLLEIQWRSTLLADPWENILIIPNSELTAALITNRSRPSPVTEISCTLAVGSENAPARLVRIFGTALVRAVHDDLVLSEPEPHVRIAAVENGQVIYRLLFCINIERVRPRHAKNAVLRHAIDYLHCAGITLHPARHQLYVPPEDPLTGRHYPLEARNAILAKVELFQPLSRDELRVLAAGLRILRPRGGQEVLAEGSEGDSMMVVVEGALEVSVRSIGDEEGEATPGPVTVGRLWPGDCFGEMSLLTGQARSATVTAAEDCCLFEITKQDLAGVLCGNPELVSRLGKLVMERDVSTRAALAAGPGDEEAGEDPKSLAVLIRRFFGL